MDIGEVGKVGNVGFDFKAVDFAGVVAGRIFFAVVDLAATFELERSGVDDFAVDGLRDFDCVLWRIIMDLVCKRRLTLYTDQCCNATKIVRCSNFVRIQRLEIGNDQDIVSG